MTQDSTDRICVGAIAGAFRVRGDVRLKSFCAVPEDIAAYGALTTEDRSRNTLENLFNVRERAREEGWRRFLIVSDPLHIARVSALVSSGQVTIRNGAVRGTGERFRYRYWST